MVKCTRKMALTVKHAGENVVVRCMTFNDIGELYFINGFINVEGHCNILKENVLYSLKNLENTAVFKHVIRPKTFR